MVVDVALSQKEERSRKRKKRLEERADSEKMRVDDKRRACATCEADYNYGHTGNESFSEGNDDDEVEFKIRAATAKKSRPPKIISPELASAVDRINVGDRKATCLIAAAAQCLGHDVT